MTKYNASALILVDCKMWFLEGKNTACGASQDAKLKDN